MENDERMRKLREQFKVQNKNIEQASSGVKEKLEKARVENAAHIEEMQEQREVEVEEIAKNTERIRESVEGVGAGLKQQLKAEYDAVANQAQQLSEKSKDDYVEPPRPPEIWREDQEELPYSLDLYLTASEDLYDVVQLDLDEETLYEDDGWEAYRDMVLKRRAEEGNSGSVTLDQAGGEPSAPNLATDEAAAMASLGAKMPPSPPPRPLPRNPPPPPPQALERHASADAYDVIEMVDDDDDDDFL